ncbi:MAG: hypothetical protein UH239_01905 [Acutalibacteraceae bacterium]|nr:hypothetical protein [Acutalibacteraceae bacterium]
MNEHNQRETFNYTYSAKQQEEVKRIREKYLPKKEDKMEQLRRLDKSVTQKGMIISLVIGVIGALILGIGMCCTMVWKENMFFPGILIGVVGIILVSIAYPLYVHITKKEREKIAPEIIRLTEELMK